MKIARAREPVLIASSILGVAIAFLAGTLGMTREARIVPLSVVLPLLPLLGFALWREAHSLPSRETAPASTPRTSERRLLGWILALPLLVSAVGLVAGSALFVTLWFRHRSGERPILSIASGLATAFLLWLLTATLLPGLPRGGFLLSLLA